MILAILALIILITGAAGIVVSFNPFRIQDRISFRVILAVDAVFIGAACALALATLWAVAA